MGKKWGINVGGVLRKVGGVEKEHAKQQKTVTTRVGQGYFLRSVSLIFGD